VSARIERLENRYAAKRTSHAVSERAAMAPALPDLDPSDPDAFRLALRAAVAAAGHTVS
jgi:hypothetical protein